MNSLKDWLTNSDLSQQEILSLMQVANEKNLETKDKDSPSLSIDELAEKYKNDPSGWAKDILGVFLWSIQRDVSDSVGYNYKTAVRAGHGVGKTFLAAVVTLWFLFTQKPSKVITVAPTWRQVERLLWSEINKLFKNKLLPQGFPGVPLKTSLNIEEDWFATGVSPEDEVSTQGYHQDNILVVVDECPGVDLTIINALESLTTTDNSHILWIGNPITPSGHFYDAFANPDEECKRFRMSVLDSPNFTGEEVPEEVAAKLTGKRWERIRRNRWGVDSSEYMRRVLGEFPEEGDTQLISLGLVETAMRRKNKPDDEMTKVLGVDVARFGNDRSTFVVCHSDSIENISELAKKPLTEVAGKSARMYERYKCDKIRVDEIGYGAAVVDMLREKGIPKDRVIGVNNASRDVIEPKSYYNIRAESWFHMKEWLKTGSILKHDKLMEDLTSPEYKYQRDGTLILESKDEIIKRLGRSPDYGDAAVLACVPMIGKREGRAFHFPDEDELDDFDVVSSVSSKDLEKQMLSGRNLESWERESDIWTQSTSRW